MPALLELIPELALGLILFAFVLSYAAGRGLLVMWGHTFGRMLLGIGGFLNYSVTVFGKHIGFDFGHVFVAANNGVVNWIEAWIRTSEEGMARTVRAMTAVAQAGIRASEWLARETAQTFDWLIGVHLPRWAKAALFPLLWPLLLAKLLRAVLPHVRSVVVKPVKVIEHTLPGKVITIVRRVGAVALPGALGIPHIWKEIRGLTKRNLAIAKRLRRLEGLLGVTGMAIAMANVFGLPNWRCLTRGNVGKTMRRLCGLSPHALESLFGLLADALILTNICHAITLLEDALGFVQPEITAFITATETWACYGGSEAPPGVSPVALDLPPLVGISLGGV